MNSPEQKPLIADTVTITGIFASASTSQKTGHQTLMILSGGKPSKVRNLYANPAVSKLVSGTQITLIARDIEWLMADFNGITYGSRSFDVAPAKPVVAAPVSTVAGSSDKRLS